MDDVMAMSRTTKLAAFEIGRLSYGCWRFDPSDVDSARANIDAALSIGANLIDTADIYAGGGAESCLGAILAADPGLRDQIVLVTKGGIRPPVPYDNRAQNLIRACDSSLARLNTDVIDVYLIHRPDILASFDEMAAGLRTLRDAGKVREVGVSNFSVSQMRALQSKLDFPLVALQPEISASHTTAMFDGVLDYAQEANVVPMAWSPLGGGALMAGRAPVCVELDRIATEQGVDRAAVAFAWLLAHPSGIVPIIGSQTPARIRASADAYDVKMTRRDWYAVLEASLGQKMP